MNARMIKELFDVCFLAKKVTLMLPPLPDAMVPRHVHIIDAISRLEEKKGPTHVGDVSALMKSTTPSVTRLLDELESLGYVDKRHEARDKRYVAVRLTEKGRNFHNRHVRAYHDLLAAALSDLDADECRIAAKVIGALHDRIREVTERFSAKPG